MKNSNAVLAALVAGALAAPQAEQKAPEGAIPDGCKRTYDGKFEISIVQAKEEGSKLMKRQPGGGAGPLTLTLKDGVMVDGDGRTASIVANHQFQFDNPVQGDAIYTSGFAVCDDNLLALGDTKTFYKCASGEFSNLYDEEIGKQCQPISFTVTPADGGSPSKGDDNGDDSGDDNNGGQEVTQIDDGQPQGPTGAAPNMPVTQIGDGQLQAPTAEAPEGQPISQIGDGQPQGPTEAPPPPPPEPTKGQPVTQIDDGQPQAPTEEAPAPPPPEPSMGQPVTQIDDGQPQAPTEAPPAPPPPPPAPEPSKGQPVTQIDDGQPQAPTEAPPAPPAPEPSKGQPVTQIDDGQPQAPTEAPPPPANTSIAVPSEPIEVPPNAGGKILPGSMVALAVGLVGMFFVL